MTETGVMSKTHIMNIPACRLDVRKNFFNVRLINEWNSLPEQTKNAKSTNQFKNLYDKSEAGNDAGND